MQHGETIRAPGEAPGLLAFESAMDELAAALAVDPVELRLRNKPELDPELQIPFSSRRLATCLREGAQRFGWDRRARIAASRREGRQLIGFGMSVGIRPNKIAKSSAIVTLRSDGSVSARLDMTDIGTGSYTILAQVAADAMGLPLNRVVIELGDSDFPATTGSGGSLGAGSSCSAVYNACVALGGVIARAAAADERSPLYGADASAIRLRDGRASIGDASESLSDIASRLAPAGLQAKTARSQLLGGMIWGLGAALHEEGVADPRYGNFVNHDLAGYHFAAHADVPQIEVVMLDGSDYNSNPVGSRALASLVSVAPARQSQTRSTTPPVYIFGLFQSALIKSLASFRIDKTEFAGRLTYSPISGRKPR